MDGWARAQALKSDPVTADVPVVVVSILDERAQGEEHWRCRVPRQARGARDLLSTLAGIGACPGAVAARHQREE